MTDGHTRTAAATAGPDLLRQAHEERRRHRSDSAGAVDTDPWADNVRPGDMDLLRQLHAERTRR